MSLRLLLALVLAFAVPLQGFAAAAAGMCMQLGHHGAADAVHSHDADGDAGAHDHHGHDAGQAQDSAPHCAPCVACCAAAAISESVPLVIADERADAVNAAGPPAFLGIPPESLDRPPLAL